MENGSISRFWYRYQRGGVHLETFGPFGTLGDMKATMRRRFHTKGTAGVQTAEFGPVKWQGEEFSEKSS